MDLEREEKEAFDEEVEHEKKKKFLGRKKNETARKNDNGGPDPSNEIDDLEDEAPEVNVDSNPQSRKRKGPSGDSNLQSRKRKVSFGNSNLQSRNRKVPSVEATFDLCSDDEQVVSEDTAEVGEKTIKRKTRTSKKDVDYEDGDSANEEHSSESIKGGSAEQFMFHKKTRLADSITPEALFLSLHHGSGNLLLKSDEYKVS